MCAELAGNKLHTQKHQNLTAKMKDREIGSEICNNLQVAAWVCSY